MRVALGRGENGFVLVSAMWLLLLGAALAALLMLRSITAARDLHAETDRFSDTQAVDYAIEVVAADLIFDGQKSRWAQLPASGALTLDGRTVQVTANAEESLPDVNKADPRLIDDALHDRGYDPAQRVALLDRIATTRAGRRPIDSYAGLAALGAGILPVGQEDCLLSALSPFGGSGAAAGPLPTSMGVRIGSVIRLTIGANRAHHVVALRLITANDRPYGLIDSYDDGCTAAGTQASA